MNTITKPSSASNVSSSRRRPHLRGRGRKISAKKSEEASHIEASQSRTAESSAVQKTSQDLPVTSPAMKKCVSAPQIFSYPSRPGGKWQPPRWREVSGGAASHQTPPFLGPTHSATTEHGMHLPPPPPFSASVLPAWCQIASTTPYQLSEDGLTRELVDFFHYTELTSQEIAARERLLRCVEASVNAVWNTSPSEEEKPAKKIAEVSRYGSYALGLSLPNSDIDLVLTFPAEEKQEVEERHLRLCEGREGNLQDAIEAANKRERLHLKRLHDLAEHLRRAHAPSLQVEVYDQCRVPRIHLRCVAAGGVSCDINSSLTSGRVACIVSRQRRWLNESPLAVFLVRVTKAAVRQWNLNEVFSGGLASTALYSLVLRFLAQEEQLYRQATLEEGEKELPPCYDEATQPRSSLGASVCCSSLSLPSSTTSSVAIGFPSIPSTTAVTPATAAVGNTSSSAFTAAAVASIPSYVPSWAQSSKKIAAAASFSNVPGKESEKRPKCGLSTDKKHGYPLKQMHSSSCSSVASSGEESSSDDAEMNAMTQEALSGTSCSTTPTSRSTTSTLPPSVSSCGSGAASSTQSTTAESYLTSGAGADTADFAQTASTTVRNEFPCVEELTRMAQSRYGASPARLLLKLWRVLSADAFLSGYQVADVFGDDAAWATSELESTSCNSSSLLDVAALELATYTGCRSSDLSAPSFRLPDLLALFRFSSTSLDHMLRNQRYPRRIAPTMLSIIFVDPRMPL